MLLGDSNAIYIGDTSIDAVYIGSNLVWSGGIPGYTKLEYIKSTNCQTINTGYIPNINTRIEAVFMLTDRFQSVYQDLFGNRSNNAAYSLYFRVNNSIKNVTNYRFGDGSINSDSIIVPFFQKFKLVCDSTGASWYDMSGNLINSISISTTSLTSSYPLYIFSSQTSNYSDGNLYSFQIYEGDTLIKDMKPMRRDADGVCGLYDIVNKQFYEDVGASHAGFLSDNYTEYYDEIEAVDTDGSLYIDTKYKHKTNTKIVIDSIPDIADNINTSRYLFGTIASGWKHDDWFLCVNDYNSGRSYGQRNQRECGDFDAGTFKNRCTVTAYGLDFTVRQLDGTTVTKTVSSTITDGINTMYLFYINTDPWGNSQQSYTRFYESKIIEVNNDTETIVRHLIPVRRKSDNVIVLYDLVTTFEFVPVGGVFKDAITMPHLDGMLCYYDCNDGIGTEGDNPVWVNRISGGSSMTLHNASVAQDGAISFYGGNDPGNGKFSCSTTESATMYVLFKRTGDGNADNYIHICGSVANGQHFPYVGDGGSLWIHGIQFMLNSNVYTDAYTGLFQYDITGDAIRDMSLSCLDYHVVCCIRQKNGAVYDNIMYVDGSLIGRIDGSSYPPGTNYGVCIGVDSFGYEDKTHDGYDTLIKMIAVSNQAHTAQQVTENSLWLMNHFNLYTPLQYIQSTNCQTINTGYIPNENSRIEAEFMLYTSVHNEWGQALFGNGTWKLFYNRNRTLQTEYRFGSGSTSSASAVLPYHKRFRLVCDKNGATWYDTGDVQIGNVSVTGTSPGSSPLYIGSDSNSYYSEYRIYSFKIYDGDTLVMNLTPVQRNEDGVCGLLDTISGNFFVDVGSQGTGYYSDRFEDSYKQLGSVETSGNLYVDTDYIHKINTKFVIDSVPDIATQTQYPGCLFGSFKNGAFESDTWVLYSRNNEGAPPRLRRGGTIDNYCDLDSMDFTKRSIITVEGLSITMLYEDGTSVQKTHSTGSITNGVNTTYIFSSNAKNNYNQYRQSWTRLYNFKIYETTGNEDTIIHNFTPVKRKFDQVIVLYDTVSNSEYPPVGGTFTGWSSNIFDTLSFSGGWLDTDGVVQHQIPENYGTSDFFECGNNTKVRVSFTPQYKDERGVMVCAYDENQTFIGSPIYVSMKPPYTLEEKEFIGEIPSGAVYLRYSYLWGKYNYSAVPNDLNTVVQLGS